MHFTTWLTQWCKRHPLKTPASHDPACYTAQVMARVRADAVGATAPAASWRRWLVWPGLGLGAAVATAALLVTLTRPSGSAQLAQRLMQDAQVLGTVDDELVDSLGLAQTDEATLADELELHDAMLLAETPPSDEQWLEHTLQLLDEVGDESATDTPAGASGTDDEWLDELQLLDESEFAATS